MIASGNRLQCVTNAISDLRKNPQQLQQVQQIFKTLKTVNQKGVTILLVEQDAYLALETAHRGYVLETGRITLEGSAQELRANPEVKRAYLGE